MSEKKKLTVKILGRTVALLLMLGMPCIVHAEDKQAPPEISIEPANPGPGDIMIVTLKHGGSPSEGTFIGKKVYFNASRESQKAIVAVDYFTQPGKYDLTVSTNGAEFKKTVEIVKKNYEVQHLTLPKDMVELSPENEARAERDQQRLEKLWPKESERSWSGDFINPLQGVILSPFGLRRVINDIPKSPHTGVDVRGKLGAQIHAPNNAVVALVDDEFFAGNAVILDHGQGIYTMFFHLSKVLVKPGQKVKKGEVIGLVGATGRATGPHLHWGARVQGARVDPLELINLKLD